LFFHFADQDIQGLARDRHHLPFLGNRNRGGHGLHIEPSAFELVAEGMLVLLEDFDVVLDREVLLQELTDYLQIHRRLRLFRGLGHHPAPFSRLLSRSPHLDWERQRASPSPPRALSPGHHTGRRGRASLATRHTRATTLWRRGRKDASLLGLHTPLARRLVGCAARW